MVVDLRSDTVTRPTPEMYEAMLKAPLGDDVLGDDPTVHELESLAASTMGKEAALFVPSGSMGNQVALATHCRPGDAAIFEEEAHMVYYEAGAPGAIAGVVTRLVPSHRGVMDPKDVEKRIMRRSVHTPGTVLLCLENTHNRAGGTVIPLETMGEYRALADDAGMKIHLDGARVFNAAVALDAPVDEVVRHADTVNFCLSKALGSPVGSVLCGPSDFIERARYVRKRLGGGMRQAGILAACGIVSLTQIVHKLPEDHRRARALAQALQSVPGASVDLSLVATNFVMVDTTLPAADWIPLLRDEGVLAMAPSAHRIRLVLHHQIEDEGVAAAAEAFHRVGRRLAA